MTLGPRFYRVAALCSIVTALTTLLLMFLPDFYRPVVEGFDGRMSRVHDPAYRLRSWDYLVHPFLAFTAALGVAMRIRAWRPAAAVIGLLGFAVWAFTEAGQQTLTLFAFDRWRAAYPAADAAMRAVIRTNTAMYDGLWDAMYFLLLIGFAIGNLSLGLALIRGAGLTRIVGILFLAAVALTLTDMAGALEWGSLPEPLGRWSEAAIQPLGRVLIGVWLWKAAREHEPLPGSRLGSPGG
jgi:hypothetical protein